MWAIKIQNQIAIGRFIQIRQFSLHSAINRVAGCPWQQVQTFQQGQIPTNAKNDPRQWWKSFSDDRTSLASCAFSNVRTDARGVSPDTRRIASPVVPVSRVIQLFRQIHRYRCEPAARRCVCRPALRRCSNKADCEEFDGTQPTPHRTIQFATWAH